MAKHAVDPRRTTPRGLVWSLLLLVALFATAGARAQPEMTPEPLRPYTAAELERLVGPIALYVDDLVGIVLPACAYPLQVVEATRFLDASANDPALRPDDDWDEAVVALLNYPVVLRMMNDDLDWTADLGEAFVYQQGDVMDAIQRFRRQALAAGNLHSDEYQTVREVDGFIEIVPADRQVVHVPDYEPQRVIRYYAGPRLDYYPDDYPLYYYPYPAGYSFGPDYFWGVSTAYLVRWPQRHVRVCPDSYVGHPYHGRRYDYRHYPRHTREGDRPRQGDANPWRPSERWGRRTPRPDRDGPARGADAAVPDNRGSQPLPRSANPQPPAIRTPPGATRWAARTDAAVAAGQAARANPAREAPVRPPAEARSPARTDRVSVRPEAPPREARPASQAPESRPPGTPRAAAPDRRRQED